MPYLRLRAYGLITALLCLAGSVQAQTPPLTADRPGIGIGTGVVLPETVQIEGGFAYDRAPRFNGYSFGQVLLRYGLNPLVELRAGLQSYRIEDYPRNVELKGFQDPTVGFKVALHDRSGLYVPSAAALFEVRLPVGDRVFRAASVQPTATLALDWPLLPGFSISANGTFTSYWVDSRRFDEGLMTATLNVTLSETLPSGAYFGYAQLFVPGRNQHYLEGGLTLLLTPDIQFDVNGGVGLHERETYFIGAGLVRRFRF